jgi:hypothetical protein
VKVFKSNKKRPLQRRWEAGLHHLVWCFELSSLPVSLVGQRTLYLLILNLEEKGVPLRSNYRSGVHGSNNEHTARTGLSASFPISRVQSRVKTAAAVVIVMERLLALCVGK